MFFVLISLISMTAGGFAVTYFYDDDAPFYVRVGAGAVIGQVIFSLVGFILGCAVGMSPQIVALTSFITTIPIMYLWFIRRNIVIDLGGLESRQSVIVWTLIYAALMIFLWFFFERAMLNMNGGIGAGSMHNTGDISFHLQAIYGFMDGQNFPPQNPSFAGRVFTYPFMVDLTAAMLALTGAKISESMFWQNMFLIVALIVMMRHFTFKLTDNAFAANLAPLLLLFSGGLGFILFFRDAAVSELGVFNYLFQMPIDYTIREHNNLRWGNSLTVLFMTQRSILMGMPVALIILTKIWEFFSQPRASEDEKANGFGFELSSVAVVGVIAGALPLVHAHSFAVTMGMSACLALMSVRHWKKWIVFFGAAAIISIPELLWATTGSPNKAKSFVDWELGWDNGNRDQLGEIIGFWLRNTGLFIPLLICAVAFFLFYIFNSKNAADDIEKSKIQNLKSKIANLLLFCAPFALCFIVPNVLRLAPWIWDNIKVLIYWFVAAIPLVSLLLATIWQRGGFAGKLATVGLILVLTLSGWLDVWRVASRQMAYQTFERDAVALARKAREIVPPRSVVVSAPSHASPAALMGRRWFMGFTGHVWSHGIDPSERDRLLRQVYFGDADAKQILADNQIKFIIVSPMEREFTVVNDTFLRQFPVVAQEGEFSLHKVE